MAQLRWIQGFLLMILQLTVAADQTSVSKRAGDEVTLKCSTGIDGQQKCSSTTWILVDSGNRASVELVELGQINNDITKADRLSLTADCSLVIKKVREKDAGRYYCQQWEGEKKERYTKVHESILDLSVLNETSEEKVQPTNKPGNTNSKTTRPETENDSTTFQATTGNKDPKQTVESKITSVTTTDRGGKAQTTKKPGSKQSTTIQAGTVNTPPTFQQTPGITAGVLVPLIFLISAMVIIRLRIKGKKIETSENAVDLGGDVSYATITHPKKKKRKTKVGGDPDAVTYSTVRACSSSAAASGDPNNLYSVIAFNN
ncbi:uncharacterized protein LOC119795872 [Cyprinodon tularosa]|uniref:uncharacterized protein LOC119795872 n=1 Tax=Cyprinodon tularosa TaxID=77115 RepID=UPI0018E27499|nr:uncharacterized protein LOC119795872 [Cyprinodon tularosa]